VDIDKTALAFGNILGNAIRFSPEGETLPSV
jgi:signal transduction histidine kinase